MKGWIGVVAAWAVCGPAAAQTLGQGTDISVPWWRVVLVLALGIALAVSAILVLRRRLGGGLPALAAAKRRLRLVESLRLSHQVDVCVLALDDRQFLVAAGPHGTVVIAGGELPPLATEVPR